MTVAKNIAIVPKLLGLGAAAEIASRVDELLDLVGLDPGKYRDRYPRELSGGQQQRVGVARGLAADPPVILMDEPFGAVDPITRQRLQDELLSIQRELRKTIVCVTHDIDEAIKLGDRILILQEGAAGRAVRHPRERSWPHPANDFVSRLRRRRLVAQAADAWPGSARSSSSTPTTAKIGEPTAEAVARAEAAGDAAVIVLDDREPPRPGRGCASCKGQTIRCRRRPRGAHQRRPAGHPQRRARHDADQQPRRRRRHRRPRPVPRRRRLRRGHRLHAGRTQERGPRPTPGAW